MKHAGCPSERAGRQWIMPAARAPVMLAACRQSAEFRAAETTNRRQPFPNRHNRTGRRCFAEFDLLHRTLASPLLLLSMRKRRQSESRRRLDAIVLLGKERELDSRSGARLVRLRTPSEPAQHAWHGDDRAAPSGLRERVACVGTLLSHEEAFSENGGFRCVLRNGSRP